MPLQLWRVGTTIRLNLTMIKFGTPMSVKALGFFLFNYLNHKLKAIVSKPLFAVIPKVSYEETE